MHWIDWAVLALYIAGTSWIANKLAGSRQTIRDFFLGGRKLPWPAVCASIIASEVSGVTFVSVPAIAWAAGGNYTYLMLAIGSLLARFIIGYYFVPAFYRQEIYSPYEFMGQRLGPAVDRVTTVLFVLGAFLAQGARLFLAALMLDSITGMGIVWAILAIGAISVVWTWMGGINSVVWTDVVQFVVLFTGGLLALGAVVLSVEGGGAEIVRAGKEAGKFRLWDFSLDPAVEFTFWCGLFGSTFLTLASHGTDQNMAQRLFCCRNAGDARKAVIWSGVSQVLPLLMLTVGVGVYAYFLQHPMTPDQLRVVTDERRDYVLPYFILNALPLGVKGLLFAAIFSAATATSTLAALAQTGVTGLYKPLRKVPLSEGHLLLVSRALVLVAAAGLCGVAILCIGMRQYKDLLRLSLNMAGYTYGALLGTFLLALLPLRRDARGLFWGVPFSLLLIFALNWQHLDWVRPLVVAAVAAACGVSVPFLRGERAKLFWVLVAAGLVLWVDLRLIPQRGLEGPLKLAFPWHYPIGAAVTLGLGVALGRKRLAGSESGSVSSAP